jgi:hypothetical protein
MGNVHCPSALLLPAASCLLPAFLKIRNPKSEIRNLKIDSDAIKLHNSYIIGGGLRTYNYAAHRQNPSKVTAL